MKIRSIAAMSASVCILGTSIGAQETTKRVTLQVNEGRPIAAAARALNQQQAIIVTYEDPRYEFQADMKDVTVEVRNPDAPPNFGAKVLVPRGESLALEYLVSRTTNELVNPSETLQQIVSAAEQLIGTGGRFEVQQSARAFHVVPKAIRNTRGAWIEQGSILDAPITLSSEEMSGLEMLNAFCGAVNEATGTTVHVGVVPLNSFDRHRGLIKADNERARDVLARILESVSDRLTWYLLYDPGGKFGYALNISVVASREGALASVENPSAESPTHTVPTAPVAIR